MNDAETQAILIRLNGTHELRCDGRVLSFSWQWGADDVITIRGSSSQEHIVRFSDTMLYDYLNGLHEPITEPLVIRTLCDFYERPGDYEIRKLSS
jgi:hypothetical protein